MAGSWFPAAPNNRIESSEWRLDIITLLAVIGESSMAGHSQTITSSSLCLLPRILPAPQALLKPVRPRRMPVTPAKVTGVKSGVTFDSVGFFASIIVDLDNVQPFEFRVVEVRHADTDAPPSPSVMDRVCRLFHLERKSTTAAAGGGGDAPRRTLPVCPPTPLLKTEDSSGTEVDPNVAPGNASRSAGGYVAFEGAPSPPPPEDADLEHGGRAPPRGWMLPWRSSLKGMLTGFIARLTPATHRKRRAVPPKLGSPIHVLGVFSMLVTVALLATAAVWTDGPAMLAVSMLSLQSSIVGWASWWQPLLVERTQTNEVPDGDVVIRTREGAFIVVKCTEEVARELISTAECGYILKDVRFYRPLMGLGTVMLMVSAVLLGNCSWNMQFFIGTSYIVLNALYWALSMLPPTVFWDLSRYKYKVVTPGDSKNAHVALADDDDDDDNDEAKASFTRTLWYAIRETKVTGWAERSGAAPSTLEWKQWLTEAEAAAQQGNREWPAVSRKGEIIKIREALEDPGRQHAPATEVQIPASRAF